MNKFLKISLLMFAISFISNSAFAADNVLQAIQVNGYKDSYNIILKSDDVAEVRKTVQAPNKMVLDLKGIRASKSINTIYNNTANVDSVVVEPTGDDTVKILVQGENVADAQVHFDSLKTPLGVLNNSQAPKKETQEVVLNGPVASYSPVYNDNEDEEEGFSMSGAASSLITILKNILKSDNLSWAVAGLLFCIVIFGGLKSIKGKDNEIKVGLSQSLKDREIDLYKGLGGLNVDLQDPMMGINKAQPQQTAAGSNYGIRAYQDGTKSLYMSAEMQRRPMMARPQSAPVMNQQISSKPMMKSGVSTMQSTIQKSTLKSAQAVKSKTTNIDSIKFLESMTKIYEKNGRTDLAQGLKANMKKAKANLA